MQVYVSRLRKALGDGVLVTRGGGYALELSGESVDADRFSRLADEGARPSTTATPGAHEALTAALALWRGPALADLAYEPFAQSEAARLEELRLVALENRAEAELALCHHAELVPELEALVREHPTRERLREALMLALYRSGRQVEALETYRDARRTLDEELGLDRGPALRELERAILTHDPAIDGPPARGALAVPRRRWRGGMLVALGGVLLLAVALAAVLVADTGTDPTTVISENAVGLVDPANGGITAQYTGRARPERPRRRRRVRVGRQRGDGTVSRIDPGAPDRDDPVGEDPSDLAFAAGSLWVTVEAARVADRPAQSRRAQDRRGQHPPWTRRRFGALWVASEADRTVTRIDLERER